MRDASGSFLARNIGEVPTIRGQVRIKQLVSEEARQIIERSYMDRQLGEVISLVESVLLDVDEGEVLRSPGYDRDLFDVIRKKTIWKCKK